MSRTRGERERKSGEEGVCVGGGDNRIGTVVINCDKGDCGRHTERDLFDFGFQMIDTSYLKATRKEKEEGGWENVAEHCWNCGGVFCHV